MRLIRRIFRKILFKVLLAVLSLAILAVAFLNIAKFVIYPQYYFIKGDVCQNPGLGDGFVCQGIAAYEANDVILVSGYMKKHSASRIYVTNMENESYYVSLKQGGEDFTGHAGGIAITGGVVYIASEGKVFTLSLESVLNAKSGDELDIGEGIDVNNQADFAYTDDTYLYVGEFHDGEKYTIKGHENETAEGTHYAICSVYALDDLTKPVKVYSVRDKVQGICFTPDGKVVMSTSYGLNDSVYYVYNLENATDSGKTFDNAPLYYLDQLEKEVNGPAMSEGLDYRDGKVITMSESASNKYLFGKLFFANKIVELNFDKLM